MRACEKAFKGGGQEGAGALKLFMFEHCSICFRVRMTAALKRLHLQETVVLEDDSETMIGLVGKRVIPILVKDTAGPCWKAWTWFPTSMA